MKWGNTPTRWGLVSRLLHWFMALAIFFMFGLGVTMINMRLSPMKLEAFMIHKSLGMLLLLIILLRLAWRMLSPAPDLPGTFSNRQKFLVRLGQWMMYGLLFCIPISGWVINSAANFPLQWFGLFEIPAITGANIAVEDYAKTVHLVLVCILGALVVGHIAAALHHHFVRGNDILQRML